MSLAKAKFRSAMRIWTKVQRKGSHKAELRSWEKEYQRDKISEVGGLNGASLLYLARFSGQNVQSARNTSKRCLEQ